MSEALKFDLAELHAMEEKNGRKFDYVRMSVCDINGISRTNSVPRRHVEKALIDGAYNAAGRTASDITGSSLITKELIEMKFGNWLHIPVKGTLRTCSWVGCDLQNRHQVTEKMKWLVGEVLCEVKWPLHYKQGEYVKSAPRFVLRRQLNKLKDFGYELMSAFEIELTLVDALTLVPIFSEKFGALGKNLAKLEDMLYYMEKKLEKGGIDILALRIESGKGQIEFVMGTKYGIETSDDAFRAKEIIKEISTSMGYIAIFQSCSLQCFSAQSCHLNLSLWKKSLEGKFTNEFYDENDPEALSKVFRHFLAGLIHHGKALTALWNPTVNCYRRINAFKLLPRFDWDFDNRKATFRVKKDKADSPYMECRKLSSACNPYLATAAILAAGMDGIKNEMPLPEKNSDFFDPGKERETKEDNLKNDTMPESLGEALDELEKNEVLKEALGEELVRWFADMKRESEIFVISSLKKEERRNKENEFYMKFI